jgi:Protein of unknown function (DUF3833)
MTITPSTRRTLLLAGVAAVLAGCASPQPSDYAGEKPTLDLRQYFNGPVKAQGLVTDRSGRVTRRFTVDLVGRWNGDEGVLEEDFHYSDGATQRRVWRLKHEGGGRYTALADDVEGVGLGETRGNALNLRYTLKVPVDGREWALDVDDWLYLVDERTMINRATLRKFGIRVAELTVAFQKP